MRPELSKDICRKDIGEVTGLRRFTAAQVRNLVSTPADHGLEIEGDVFVADGTVADV